MGSEGKEERERKGGNGKGIKEGEEWEGGMEMKGEEGRESESESEYKCLTCNQKPTGKGGEEER